MIDLALCNRREIITDCGVITRADKGSDHRLVRLKVRINKRLARAKAIHKLKPLKVNMNELNSLSATSHYFIQGYP